MTQADLILWKSTKQKKHSDCGADFIKFSAKYFFFKAKRKKQDERRIKKIQSLDSYFSENYDALPGYYDRGIKIPKTREPGVIHHARFGSIESNVFALIGNRMKFGRAYWSIEDGNNLAVRCLPYRRHFMLYLWETA